MSVVLVNGAVYTFTGDMTHQWLASYSLNTSLPSSVGWNTNYSWDDSAFVPVTVANYETPYWFYTGIALPLSTGAPAFWLWGGSSGVNTRQNTIIYRVKLPNMTYNSALVPLFIATPTSGKYLLEVQSAANLYASIYINGTVYASTTGFSASAVLSNKQYVNDGPLLIAFQIESLGTTGGLMASVLLNGIGIAATGDASNWKVSYSYTGSPLPVGWNTDVNFDTSNWSSFVGTCPAANSPLGQFQTGMSVNGTLPNLVWGPTCSSLISTITVYRLLINVSPSVLSPVFVPPYIGPNKLEVRYSVDDYVTTFIGNKIYIGYGVLRQTSQSVIQYLDAGKILVAMAIQETSGATGGMSIVVLINGRPVAVSGDSFVSAKVNYNLDLTLTSSTGWNSVLNFDDSAWMSWNSSCVYSRSWNPALANLTAGTSNIAPKILWGPQCTSVNNPGYLRIVVDVQPLPAPAKTTVTTTSTKSATSAAATSIETTVGHGKPKKCKIILNL